MNYNRIMDLDAVTLNTLLADSVDAPTAIAASIVDTEPTPADPQSASTKNRKTISAYEWGLIAGLALFTLYMLM